MGPNRSDGWTCRPTLSLLVWLGAVVGCSSSGESEAPPPIDIVLDFEVVLTDLGPDIAAEVLIEPGPCDGLSDGDPCDDANACTVDEHCQDGFCGGGAPLTCDGPSEGCSTTLCDPAVGCVTVTATEGAACDAHCFDQGVCAGGECVPVAGTEVVCPASTDPCIASVGCDPGTGTCTRFEYALACPAGDVCQADPELEGSILECVAAYESLCRPCTDDAQCASTALPGAVTYCVDSGAAGSFCGGDCANLECPPGYECDSVDGAAGPRPQCRPAAGAACSCDAGWASAGYTTACARENQHGSCSGQRGCGPGGLSPCDARVPAPESCDGIDNDCNGLTDDVAAGCGTEGACCLSEGGCEVLPQLSCAGGGGSFKGFGLSCSEVSCGGQATGACCQSDLSCSVLGAGPCADVGGAYKGDATVCGAVDCAAADTLGACCNFLGNCSNLSALSCAETGGTFAGKGTNCTQSVCDQQGACCLPSLACLELTEASCSEQSGDFKPLVGCGDTACVLPPGEGACCLDGGCDLSTESSCVGQFLEGEPCVGQCPGSVLGACCAPLGGCLILSEETCPTDHTFAGIGAGCDACEVPTGACCKVGNCYPGLTEVQCDAVNADWQGPESTCEDCP